MNDKLVAIKAAIAAVFTALGAFLGWQGILMIVWVAVMALDYLTGTLAACKASEWSSSVAREGLWHKGGMIAVVVVAMIADWVMVIIAEYIPIGIHWPGIVLPLVLAWYIITELGSILENAVKMGANVPGWLVKLMKAGASLVNKAGENAADEIGDGEEVMEEV